MNDDLFKEYKIESKVDSKIINKYKVTIPSELTSVWEIWIWFFIRRIFKNN